MGKSEKFNEAVECIRTAVKLSNSNIKLSGDRVAYLGDGGNCIMVHNLSTGSISVIDSNTADDSALDEIRAAYPNLSVTGSNDAILRIVRAYIETMTDEHDCQMLLSLLNHRTTDQGLESVLKHCLYKGKRGLEVV